MRSGRATFSRWIRKLRERKLQPLWLGEIIVATLAKNSRAVLDAIQELDLKAEIATNNETIMVLPAGVNKATGLAVALDDLGISREAVISVGDGENDTILFEFTGCGVAVADATAVVKSGVSVKTTKRFNDEFLRFTLQHT
jgi:HAD superfamily hydrolase (TIGR01484 family)